MFALMSVLFSHLSMIDTSAVMPMLMLIKFLKTYSLTEVFAGVFTRKTGCKLKSSLMTQAKKMFPY